MKTTRRNFVKAGALAALGSALIPRNLLAWTAPGHLTGLQLYSVRDDMWKDPQGSLKALAGMGYVYVEHAGYSDRKFYGISTPEFRRMLDNLGLVMISGHTTLAMDHWSDSKKNFSDIWKQTVDDAAAMGQKWVISPWMDEKMRKSYDDLRKWLDIFNRCGELCHKSGMKFGYHNHDFEFSQVFNGEKVFDIMMKNIEPGLVSMQLDIGNLYNGGAVALDVMNQYPGRFDIIHVKDEIEASEGKEKYISTILGEGVVNAQKVVELASRIGGTTCFIIEQESYGNITPMECVRKDLEIMKKWGF